MDTGKGGEEIVKGEKRKSGKKERVAESKEEGKKGEEGERRGLFGRWFGYVYIQARQTGGHKSTNMNQHGFQFFLR